MIRNPRLFFAVGSMMGGAREHIGPPGSRGSGLLHGSRDHRSSGRGAPRRRAAARSSRRRARPRRHALPERLEILRRVHARCVTVEGRLDRNRVEQRISRRAPVGHRHEDSCLRTLGTRQPESELPLLGWSIVGDSADHARANRTEADRPLRLHSVAHRHGVSVLREGRSSRSANERLATAAANIAEIFDAIHRSWPADVPRLPLPDPNALDARVRFATIPDDLEDLGYHR